MTASLTPLIIEVRANEFADRTRNAAIPYGADAIVSDALDSLAAGATMYHWHARGEDGIDRPNDVDLHRAVATRLGAETELILHPTLGFVSTQGDAAGRTAPILEIMRDPASAIDIVPVDFGAFTFDEWDTSSRRFASGDRVLLNKTGYLQELLAILRDHAIPVMAVVWSSGESVPPWPYVTKGFCRLRPTGSWDSPETVCPVAHPQLPANSTPSSTCCRPRNNGQFTFATGTAWKWRH